MTWGSIHEVAEAQTIKPPSTTRCIDYIDHANILRTADLYARNSLYGETNSPISDSPHMMSNFEPWLVVQCPSNADPCNHENTLDLTLSCPSARDQILGQFCFGSQDNYVRPREQIGRNQCRSSFGTPYTHSGC